MTKLRKSIILIFILVVSIITPIFAGCDFDFSAASGKLDTPVLSINETNYTLSWSNVASAKSYQIYCNDDLLVQGVTERIYDFENVLTDAGVYTFYVKAIPYLNSIPASDNSNTCSYLHKIESIIWADDVVIDRDATHKINLRNNGLRGVVFDRPVSDVEYELYLYSSHSGLNVYPVESNISSINLNMYSLKNEIYAVRMGYVLQDTHYVSSDIIYINPDNYIGYTDNIYMFDGQINDFYIESVSELRNLVYYAFIYRLSNIEMRLSRSFANAIEEGSESGTMVDKVNQAVISAFGYLYETCDSYDISTVQDSATERIYTTTISWGDTSVNNQLYPTSELVGASSTVLPQVELDGYYDVCGYTMLTEQYSEPYDNFVSDNQFLYTTVRTSEELYWAVENHVTPVFPNTTCPAYSIYQNAKNVLREIISEEMTDYEKVRCIFDWIAINTQYDYYSTYTNSYRGYPVTTVPCYYLEGVFTTHFAVCDGFSKAFSLMCNMLGIDAIRVVGTANTGGSTGGHAWNKVYIDEDTTDDEMGNWFICDITWTEITSASEEATTHSYFMLSDADIEETHIPFNRRSEFFTMPADYHYDYYDNSTFNYLDVDYDLVINSEEEVEAMFYYLFLNQRQSIEVVMTKTLIEKIDRQYASETASVINPYKRMETAMTLMMKKKKFAEQYLFVYNSGYTNGFGSKWFTYNSNGDKGILYVFQQHFLIDDANEEGHLMSQIAHYQLYGTYSLWVDRAILDAVSMTELELSGLDDLQKDEARVRKLFAATLNNNNLEATFDIITIGITGDDRYSTQSHFTMVVSPRS